MAAEQPPQNIATAIAEVSERAALLVHEEIELAKAEISEKLTHLRNALIVGATGGIFAIVALLFALDGFAWLISNAVFGGDSFYAGFFIMAFLLLLGGAGCGYAAFRFVQRGSAPTPTMAIDEAKKIRKAVSAAEGSS